MSKDGTKKVSCIVLEITQEIITFILYRVFVKRICDANFSNQISKKRQSTFLWTKNVEKSEKYFWTGTKFRARQKKENGHEICKKIVTT